MAAVSGGFAMDGGESREGAITYAVQMYALKGEDKFVAVPDVFSETNNPSDKSATRRNKARRTSRVNTNGANNLNPLDDDDEDSFDEQRSGDFLACFGVFDGHVNASASSHCERKVLDTLIQCGADVASAPLESACVTAFERVEKSFASGSGCLPSIFSCIPASRGGSGSKNIREGGTTASVVCVQRRKRGPNGEARVDLVAANSGDSGSLFVPFKVPITGLPSRSPRLTAEIRRSIDEDAATAPDMPEFRRLTRDHNPDDPFEARRLVDAGARLGRMRQGGQEIGPMRVYPGGLAVSRAIGDLNAPAVICKPECTRVPVPNSGGRVVLASDGLWNALGDGEVATITTEAETNQGAAHTLLRAVFQRRGAHDDITLVVIDVPPPNDILKWAVGRCVDDANVDTTDDTPSPLAPAKAQKSIDQMVRDARRVSLEQGKEPFPEWAETRDVQARANRGRSFNIEADVTVRRGLDPAFSRASTLDTQNKTQNQNQNPRPINSGCLACLLGGGVDHSALADVDDADAEEGASLRDDYVLGAVLGRGMYGSVRLAYLKPGRRGSRDFTGENNDPLFSKTPSPEHPMTTLVARAVKSIATDGSKRSAERVRDEVDAMYAVSGRHPNLPTVFASYEQKTVGAMGGSFLQVIHIVTEAYTGGDLVAAISRRGSLLARDWEAVAAQLLGATASLHAVGVVHRDIKPENVMLKRPWKKGEPPACVLVDFGGAAFARGKTRVLTGFVGTKFFGAPECFTPGSRHGAKSDVWSIGVLLLTILAGTPPAYELGTAWRALHAGTIPAILKPPPATPRRFKRLMESLLTTEPDNRPSAAEALSGNPWLMGHNTVSHQKKGAERPQKAVPVFLDDSYESSSSTHGSPMHSPSKSMLFHGDEELANSESDLLRKNTTNAARSEFSRAAAYILSVCLDARAIDKLVAELRPGHSSSTPSGRKSFDALGGADGVVAVSENSAPFTDDEVVLSAVLEKALWTTGAREAAMQLELLRAQTVTIAVNDLARQREEQGVDKGKDDTDDKDARGDEGKVADNKSSPLASTASASVADKKLISDALSVEFKRLSTLADLHQRHRRVYEAVVVAKSDKSRTGRFTKMTSGKSKEFSTFKPSPLQNSSDKNDSAHRLNQGDSMHGGMLMAMLARQNSRSNLDVSRRGDSGSGSYSSRFGLNAHTNTGGFPSPISRDDDSSREGSGSTLEGSSHHGVSSRDVELAPWSKPLINTGVNAENAITDTEWWEEETAFNLAEGKVDLEGKEILVDEWESDPKS